VSETALSNDEFTAFWNDVLAVKFDRFRDILILGLGSHSKAPLSALELPPGSSALDVGCGWGDTAIELAQKVGSTGSVVGIDCCRSFLEYARVDAQRAGLTNVRFVEADVQTYAFRPEYDFCFSRFGMMFFAHPVAAMRNVKSALKPGAVFMFITWRSIEDNPWALIPKKIMREFLPPPSDDAQTCGPGPFSMASPDVVKPQLTAAGFTDIEFKRIDVPVMVGRNVEQAMQFQFAIGPAGEIFREAGEKAEHHRAEIEQALRSELGRHLRDGEVFMPSGSWTITARRPE